MGETGVTCAKGDNSCQSQANSHSLKSAAGGNTVFDDGVNGRRILRLKRALEGSAIWASFVDRTSEI